MDRLDDQTSFIMLCIEMFFNSYQVCVKLCTKYSGRQFALSVIIHSVNNGPVHFNVYSVVLSTNTIAISAKVRIRVQNYDPSLKLRPTFLAHLSRQAHKVSL